MAKAKANKDSGGAKTAGKSAKTKVKAGGKKKAAAAPKAEVAAQDVTAAAPTEAKADKKSGKKKAAAAPKADKKSGKKKAAAVEAAAPAAEAKASKKAGKKKAEAAPKADKKSGKKKAAATEAVVEAPAPAAKASKAGKKKAEAAPKADKKSGKKKAAAAPAPEAKASKKSGKKKAAAAEAAPEPAPKAKKSGKKKAEAAPAPATKASKASKKSGKKKAEPAPKADKKSGKKKAAAAAEPAAKTSKKSGKKKAAKAQTEAERSDRHRLYQLSVQSPEADLEFFTARYEELRGRVPKVLREDFCGTAFLSATWAASMPDRRAVGIDLDGPTLEWGRTHNVAAIPKAARSRVELRQANVLDGGGEPADVTCAMNFSYGVFKTRAELRRYFEVVYEQLAEDGIFITELYGGVEAIVQVEDEREIEDPSGQIPDFTYVWEQAEYNPITHETLCHIHFQMSDGSRIERAFTYDWRLWTIPELRELLYEAGFTSVRVFWEATDEDGDGTGDYYATEKEDNQESWLVYLVAAK